MQQRVRQWAANRTTDRQSLRFAIWDNRNLHQRLAQHEDRIVEQNKALAAKVKEAATATDELGKCEIQRMNLSADVTRLRSARNRWAFVSLTLTAAAVVAIVVR